MGPREKKKMSSPRKQMTLDTFFKSVTKSSQKRPRDEGPGESRESPLKRSKEVENANTCSNNNEINLSAAAVNNNNNNNNNNNKKPSPKEQGTKKSPEGSKKKAQKNSEEMTVKTSLKNEKNNSPQKSVTPITKREKIEKVDDMTFSEDVDDPDEIETPHPLINIPETDQVLIVAEEQDSAPTSEGEFIGPDMAPDSEDYRGDEDDDDDSGSVTELLPISVTSPLPPPPAPLNEMDSRILTPSPSPSPQVPQKSFKCKVCDEWFPNRYFQRKHMLMEHEDQLYECRVCSYNSCDPEKLKSHIIKMHVAKKEKTESVTINEAQYDLEEFITKQTPRKVIMEDGVALGRDPSSKMRFICAICDRIYTSKYSLERHVRCHTGEKPYTCDVCNFTTSYREHMQRHMTSVHLIVHSDEPKQKYVGKRNKKKTEEKNVSTEDDDVIITNEGENGESVEGKDPQVEEETPPVEEIPPVGESPDVEGLITPIEGESHEGSFESQTSSDTTSSASKKRRNILRKRFECAACGLKATHKTDLIDHIREKHPNAHIESLENGDGSKVHLIVTASKKNNSSRRMVITCPNCFMIFHDTWKYKVHMRSHTGVKPFGCSLCAFRATSKMTIRDHVHRKHKDHPNPKILLRTVGIDGTVQHVELNFPQREFKCDVCDESFKDNYHMKQHKKKTHVESLPFSCVSCSHREWARASIIIHVLQSHPDSNIEGMVLRNNKPFTVGPHKLPKCDVCDKYFSYQSQLYLHQRQHTGERTYICDICNYRTNHKPALQKHIEKHLTGPGGGSKKGSPDIPAKKSGRKKNSRETNGPLNFVEVEGNSAEGLSEQIVVKKEGAKKKAVKVKKEKEKKDKENVKKEKVNVKKEKEKVKKANVRVKKEKSDKEKGKSDKEKGKKGSKSTTDEVNVP